MYRSQAHFFTNIVEEIFNVLSQGYPIIYKSPTSCIKSLSSSLNNVWLPSFHCRVLLTTTST